MALERIWSQHLLSRQMRHLYKEEVGVCLCFTLRHYVNIRTVVTVTSASCVTLVILNTLVRFVIFKILTE